MIWLQSNDKYDELAKYEHNEGTFTIESRNTLDVNAPSSTEGIFAILSSVFVALYKFGEELFIRIGDQCIPMVDDVTVTVRSDTSKRLLIVEKAGSEITRLIYVLDNSQKIQDDPTPFINDEDFDFGLFISNVSTSDKRKKILLGLDITPPVPPGSSSKPMS